jgi:hypothetical protein
MEITNGKPCQSSMLWRAAWCHCQVAKFLLYTFFHQFEDPNTFLNSYKYIYHSKQRMSILDSLPKSLVWTLQHWCTSVTFTTEVVVYLAVKGPRPLSLISPSVFLVSSYLFAAVHMFRNCYFFYHRIFYVNVPIMSLFQSLSENAVKVLFVAKDLRQHCQNKANPHLLALTQASQLHA